MTSSRRYGATKTPRLTFAIIAVAATWSAFSSPHADTRNTPIPASDAVQSAAIRMQTVPKSTRPSSRTAKQSPATSREKIIYGEDDRLDVFEVTDAARRQQAAATCAVVFDTDLAENDGGTFTLRTVPFALRISACDDEPFRTQPTAPFCTAFLVAPDIVVTAGHCLAEDGDSTAFSINTAKFVFGFDMADADTAMTEFEPNQVYSGISILGRNFPTNTDPLDFAVIRLDREVDVSVAVPLEYRREGTPESGTPVGVIGHPSGLPKKIAFGDQTQVFDSSSDIFFIANTDTYEGNSGSPIINAQTGEVEGILVGGFTDFVTDVDCFRSNQVPDDSAGTEFGEICTKITFIQGYIDGTMGGGLGCATSPPAGPRAPSPTAGEDTFVLLAVVLILRARRPSAT